MKKINILHIVGGGKVDKKKLSDEAREKRNAYARSYRKKNKKKIAEYNRRYWEKKADQNKKSS